MGFIITQGLDDRHFLHNIKNLGYCWLIKTKEKEEQLCSFSLGERQDRNSPPQQAKYPKVLTTEGVAFRVHGRTTAFSGPVKMFVLNFGSAF